jgi:hypothetical protein
VKNKKFENLGPFFLRPVSAGSLLADAYNPCRINSCPATGDDRGQGGSSGPWAGAIAVMGCQRVPQLTTPLLPTMAREEPPASTHGPVLATNIAAVTLRRGHDSLAPVGPAFSRSAGTEELRAGANRAGSATPHPVLWLTTTPRIRLSIRLAPLGAALVESETHGAEGGG